jgi:hypothetical protein
VLYSLKSFYGHRLAAKDGAIGEIQDILFDDQSWGIRYLVADTGSWLDQRLVLLSPKSFGAWDRAVKTLLINLTRAQIEGSPSINRHLPVSRQFERDYHAYYGWPTYWAGDGFGGMVGDPMMMPVLPPADRHSLRKPAPSQADSHLQSAQAVKGYDLEATDGPVGRVTDLLAEDEIWRITQLVVQTGHWYAGNEILVATDQVRQVSYEAAQVRTSLSRAELQRRADSAAPRTH